MVGSSLKYDNWFQSKSLHLSRHFFHLLTPPRFGALNRESEFTGSLPVNRKLFPYGPHSSKNNVLKLRYPGQSPYRLPLFHMRSKVDLSRKLNWIWLLFAFLKTAKPNNFRSRPLLIFCFLNYIFGIRICMCVMKLWACHDKYQSSLKR